MDDEPNYDRILTSIAACQDIDKLMVFFTNSQKRNVAVIQDAALLQLKGIIPKLPDGSFEHAFWTMFDAYQTSLLKFRKPTIRLNQAYNTALIEGEVKVLEHWVEDGAQVWAFNHLLSQNRDNETAEGLVLAFPDKFSNSTVDKARKRITLAKKLTLAATP